MFVRKIKNIYSANANEYVINYTLNKQFILFGCELDFLDKGGKGKEKCISV